MKEFVETFENLNLNTSDPRFSNLVSFKERYYNSVNLPGPWHVEYHLDSGFLFITHEEERQSDDYKIFNNDYVIVGTFATYTLAVKEFNNRIIEMIGFPLAKKKVSLIGRLVSFIKSIPFPKVNLDRI
jgi:hypothetical protein